MIAAAFTEQVSQHPVARRKGHPCTMRATLKKQILLIMKKTIIALMAMAGAAFGADYTTETAWTLDFGSEYTNGFQWTAEDGYSYGTPWDIVAVEGGSQTNGSKRVHMAGGKFGSWDEDFQFAITLTLGETISASNAWPVFGEIAGSGTALRFGPYTNMNNTVAIDGNLTKTDGANNLVSVAPGGTYTVTLTKIGKDVTVAVDGTETGHGVLADTVSGNITDIMLGGNQANQYRINQVVHSASYSVLTVNPVTPAVPEPTTATLSLLALAGLAARRRRASR